MRPNFARTGFNPNRRSTACANIAAQGYRIVLNVGDQWSDLGGMPEAELSVKYPYPNYFIP
jgi:hypothetical protein